MAVIGTLIVAAGTLVAWMLRHERWPVVAGGAVMFVPTLILGGIVLGLAALWHVLRAEWHLTADCDGVVLMTRTARGWVLKREAVAACRMTRIGWIEGDADVSPGLRIETRTRKALFIPAGSFDCVALAAFAVSTYPGVVEPGLIEQASASARLQWSAMAGNAVRRNVAESQGSGNLNRVDLRA